MVRVNGTGFEKCEAPAGTEALTTGEDTLTLTSPGKKWYICSMGNHCKSGNMRLTITVLAELGSPTASPSPSPVSAAVATGRTGLSGCGGWIAVAIAGIPFHKPKLDNQSWWSILSHHQS